MYRHEKASPGINIHWYRQWRRELRANVWVKRHGIQVRWLGSLSVGICRRFLRWLAAPFSSRHAQLLPVHQQQHRHQPAHSAAFITATLPTRLLFRLANFHRATPSQLLVRSSPAHARPCNSPCQLAFASASTPSHRARASHPPFTITRPFNYSPLASSALTHQLHLSLLHPPASDSSASFRLAPFTKHFGSNN